MEKERNKNLFYLLIVTIIFSCLSLLFLPENPLYSADGERWVRDGDSLNLYSKLFVYAISTRHALNPSIVTYNDIPYVTWIEINSEGISQLYVKRLTDRGWEQVGGTLNWDTSMPASSPSIATDNNFIYVAWIEREEINERSIPQLYVKRWRDREWEKVGSNSLNIFSTKYTTTPSLGLQGKIPYVAWIEINESNVSQLYVKKWTGREWEQIGGSLNVDIGMHASSPSIALEGDTPYVTWSEVDTHNIFQLYVKKWTGREWEQIGGSLNVDIGMHASSPSIALEGDTPYVTWSEINKESIFHVYVKRWDGKGWSQVGETLNVNPIMHALTPTLVLKGDIPYVTWKETNPQGVYQIYVKHLE